jgi:aspartyl-tRNA(Asn)/glutamyl-tRNA(Gln) amidotransferase subunit A
MTWRPRLPGIAEMSQEVRDGAVSPSLFARRSVEAIRQDDRGELSLHAFLSVLDDRELDALGDGPRVGRLAGVPIAIKDNLATLGLPTTCGSRILEGYRSGYEATVVRRLREAGAIIIGKTNMDEFGMGSSTEHSAFGPTRNPRDLNRVPGGSSGGSAAAVAAGLVPAALGSDTGGSVRQPASLCGVVGIKPTYGRVSRYGLVAFASSLDQVGTLARTVEDAAVLLEVISGWDPRDSTTAEHGAMDAVTAGDVRGASGLVVGVPSEHFRDTLDASIRDLCVRALGRLEGLGAEVRPVSLPHAEYAIPAYYIIAPAEASSNLARYDGVRYGLRVVDEPSVRALHETTRSEGLGAEVKRRILLGTYVLFAGYHEAYYGRAQRVRGLIRRDFDTVFGTGVDLIFTPTSPTTAFRLGERLRDPVKMYLSDVFTVSANLAGIPALSLPIGEVGGLPVGGQLLGPRWSEPKLIRAAMALESSLGSGGAR